jgi:hypothetical protein
MEQNPDQAITSPPRLIPSLSAGFNAVANNVSLLILPVVVDLLLWFGPHVRIKSLFAPFFLSFNEQALLMEAQLSPDLVSMMVQSQEAWDVILERFNLLSVLRTLPVGVPSLLAFRGVIQNPIGRAAFYESSTILGSIGSWIAIVVAGILLGTIYFGSVARSSGILDRPFSARLLAGQFVQTMLLTLTLALVLAIIIVPMSLVLAVSALINPNLGQVTLFAMTFLALWLLLPLFFSPHGIFMDHSRARDAVFQSLRLARLFMPNTGLMILLIILIGQGLNIIWLLPKWDSWMVLLGIAGHAFISSGLLAATFVYYRDGMDWMEKLSSKNNLQPQQGDTLHS